MLIGQDLHIKEELIRESFFGGSASEKITKCIEDFDGNLVCIGYTEKGVGGSRDIAFFKMDASLQLIAENNIGRRKKDRGYDIIRDIDGGYVVAGYSEKPGLEGLDNRYAGKRDGWVLWVDETGEPKHELLLGTEKHDSWVKILPNFPQGYFLLGNHNAKAWLASIDLNGTLLWERDYSYFDERTKVNTGLIQNGHLYLIGYAVIDKDRKMWVMELKLDGKTVREQVFPTAIASEGLDVTSIDQKLLIGGYSMSLDKREQGCMLILNDQLKVEAYECFGGREFDQINRIGKLPNEQIVLGAGLSNSFQRGARRTKGWIVKYNLATKEKEEFFYGSKLNDAWYDLIQKSNSWWYAAGASQKKLLKNNQAWVGQLTRSSPKQTPIDKVTSIEVIQKPVEQLEHLNKQIEIISLGFKPQGNLKTLYNLKVSLRIAQSQKLIRSYTFPPHSDYAQPLLIPIPNNLQEFGIIQPTELVVDVRSGDNQLAEQRFFYKPQMLEEEQPLLVIDYIRPTGKSYQDSLWQMEILVQNKGTGMAQDVNLQVIGPDGYFLFPSQLEIGKLNPEESQKTDLTIQAKPGWTTPNATFTLRVLDRTLQFTDTASFTIVTTPAKLTPNSTAKKGQEKYIVATWINPNPDLFDRNEIVLKKPELNLQVKVISSHPLGIGDYCLELNDRPCVKGKKMDEVQMIGRGPGRTYIQRIALQEGKNRMKVIVENEAGIAKTQPITVIRPVKKPNLHLLSIGVPSPDLKYTTNDAIDFANAFINQYQAEKNQAFGHIFCDTLVSTWTTSKTEILKSLKRLEYRALDNQIQEEDLVVLFISSHGVSNKKGQFRIAASDYDSPFMRETSLDFSTEIMEYLASLPGKKTVFIDACHSGSVSSLDNNELAVETLEAEILKTSALKYQNIHFVLSCQPTEYSYEDDEWKNGAFTEGILEAFATFYEGSATVDLNQDNKLTIKELFSFIKTTVPNLVGDKKPKTRTGQIPLLHLNQDDPGPYVLIDLQNRKND